MRRLAFAPGINWRTRRRWSLTRRMWHDEGLAPELVVALWRDVDRLLYSSKPLQVKDRCVVVRHDHADGALLLKRHSWGGLTRTMRSAWREASARRCGRLGMYLAKHGIPTPLPRACLEYFVGPWGFRSYLLTDYIEGTTLYRYIRNGAPAGEELRHVAQQVARIWQRLVELGISHNDMKPENFIVDENFDVWLIDLEKVRLRGNAGRQRQRNIFDMTNFLHIRGWHHRADARACFLDQFLSTPSGKSLRAEIAGDEARSGQFRDEVDADLSVLILCDEGVDVSLAQPAIDSIRDIADEILLVSPREGSRLEVLDRIEPCGEPTEAPEWTLVLHQNELVTPFLAKELQQRITSRDAEDAIRIPIEPQYFGRSVASVARGDARPIRLFRRERCSYSLASGVMTISADPEQTGQLTGTIEKSICTSVADFIDRLNKQTSLAAACRLQEGHRPRLLRGAIRAMGRFLKSCVWNGGFRSGWTGLQLAFLKAVFVWVEEAKLHQMSAEFRLGQPAIPAFEDGGASDSDRPVSATSPRAKAA